MDLSFLDAVGGPKVVGAVVAGVVGLWVVSKLMKPKADDTKTQFKQCGACGWSGNVTLFKPKCPKCASAM